MPPDASLRDREWRLKYTPDEGDLVRELYVPLLDAAVRYDRLTGYFNAAALALAARGVEGLVRNDGRMRMVVGCTLDLAEVAAIEAGARLRDQVGARLLAAPLLPADAGMAEVLELLAWLVAQGRLEVKVARALRRVPAAGRRRRPVPREGRHRRGRRGPRRRLQRQPERDRGGLGPATGKT